MGRSRLRLDENKMMLPVQQRATKYRISIRAPTGTLQSTVNLHVFGLWKEVSGARRKPCSVERKREKRTCKREVIMDQRI